MKKTLLSAALAGFAVSAMAQDFKWQPFLTETYDEIAQVGDVWTAPSNQGGLSLVVEDNGNKYVQYNHGNNNSRGLYNIKAYTEADYEGIDEYRLEFDLALTSGSNQFSTFSVGSPDIQTMGSDWVTPCGNITKYPNNGLGSGSLFSLIQESANSDYWRVYCQGPVGTNPDLDDPEIHVTLAAGTFYHFALTVSPAGDSGANVEAEITDMDGNPVMFTYGEEEVEKVTLPYLTEASGAYWFKQFYVLSGRYNSVMKIDNIQVMKKVDANSVTPPTLTMTAVKYDGRVISLSNGKEADELLPYYAIVDESTYEAFESVSELNGKIYDEPFVVSEPVNYVVAWNVNAEGKASEPVKAIYEAGWTPQLNAPTISATDYSGYNKTYVATCTQSDIRPLAPVSYTIYMSADSTEWVETSTFTVTGGKVYAKVEADGYGTGACNGVEVPDGVYGCSKWTVAGMVINSETCPLFNFDNSGKGRVHVPVQYWSEDYSNTTDDGETIEYDEENAWAQLKKNGMHFKGGAGDMFLLGSGNANGFTITGLTIYNSNKGYITIDNLQEGNTVQVKYNDGSAQILTVNDPETFTVPVPKYGGAALASIEIKGPGTVETREAKAGEWGILCSTRTVANVDHAGATFYDHKYTIFNSETNAADTLLLQPVNALEPGVAYIYQADADAIELIYLDSEEPVEEQSREQLDFENATFYATIDEAFSDMNLYTMFPGGILMKNKDEVNIPIYSGYFEGLDGGDAYLEVSDFKLLPEYEKFIADYEKAIEDYNNAEPQYEEDEDGNVTEIQKPELDAKALWDEKYSVLLSKYTVIPVVHEYNEEYANAVAAAKAEGETLVNVVTPAGVVVRHGVKASEALNGLKRGLYIVGKKKVVK